MKYAQVNKKLAEKLKKFLAKNNLGAEGFPIKITKEAIAFAVTKEFKFQGVTFKDFKVKAQKKESLQSLMSSTEIELSKLPTGFDTVGEIAILDINESVKKYEKEIASNILKLHNNITTVVKKASEHAGEFRLQMYTHLAGKKTLVTIHKENNARIKLDISKVYYSPRSSTERLRVAKQIKPGENVLVMFSGCGPFVFVIAKNSKAKNIVGIELNPEGHKFALENKKINKVENVVLLNGDVRKIIPTLNEKFDRIVMPLPKTGELFLKDAITVAKKNTIIHFYDFENEVGFIKTAKKKIENRLGKKIKVLNGTLCGSYSPALSRICIDFKVLN